MVGESDAMCRLREQISAVAVHACTVLIQGETGTGKELVARHIHHQSDRATGPFVPVDCSTLPETLFESQMFGHVRGAFTGADFETLGFIRSADGGTLFLDEIGEMPLPAQAKLLRCLQERTVVPVGSTQAVPVDIRLIAATHRDLASMVDEGTFRQDLFYRLNVAQMRTPSLRERREDLEALARHFLADFARVYDEPAKSYVPGLINVLMKHDWPGNVRELGNALEYAFIFSKSRQITSADLPNTITRVEHVDHDTQHDRVIPTLSDCEKDLIARALRACRGNQTRASELLGIERHRLRRKIARYELEHLAQTRSD